MNTVHVEPLWTCVLVTLCAFLVLMQPTLRYTITGWKAKRKDILDSLSPEARRTYFLMFAGGQGPPKDPEEASTRFEEFYTAWYGRRYFLFPGILLGLTGLTAISAVVFSILGEGIFAPNPIFKIPLIANAALAAVGRYS